MLLTEHLPHINWDELYENLRRSGARFDIIFSDVTLLSNSRMSLEAGEFARDHGMFERFHEQIFYTYFTETKNIGNIETIMEAAENTGLDSHEMQQALNNRKYLPRLEQSAMDARNNNITSVPTFIIEDKHIITGAQPVEVFRDALKNLG